MSKNVPEGILKKKNQLTIDMLDSTRGRPNEMSFSKINPGNNDNEITDLKTNGGAFKS